MVKGVVVTTEAGDIVKSTGELNPDAFSLLLLLFLAAAAAAAVCDAVGLLLPVAFAAVALASVGLML